MEQGFFLLDFNPTMTFAYALVLFTATAALSRFSASVENRARFTIDRGSYLFQALIGLILSDMSVLRAKSRSTGAHPNSRRVNNSRLRFGQG